MPLAHPTILLVDDDEPTRRILRRWLAHLDLHAQVVEAEDGAQALAAVKAHCALRHEPRSLLVLLDLNMPVMDGLEFLEQQVQLPAACRQLMAVIVISATPDRAEQEKARDLAVDLRPKPLDIEQVRELVRSYLPDALN